MGKSDKKYRLKLKSLSFISAVDRPAQETATALLLKRSGPKVDIVKVDEALGLVFAWAWTSKVDGEAYTDLQGDEIVDGDETVKVAADFMAGQRLTDTMHDRDPDGTVVFCMPMNAEIAKAYGVTTDTHGLMVAIKPSADTFAKFVSGEYTGVSIDATGIREAKRAAAHADVAKRGRLTGETDGHTHLVDDSSDSGYTHSDHSHGYHSHPFEIVDGVMTIGASAGHTHAAPASAEKRAPAQQTFPVLMTPAANAAIAKTAPQETAMTTDADRIKALETEVATLKTQAEMTDAEKAHADRLAGPAQAAFLAKGATDRLADVAKATEVVYTATDGTRYTKLDDERTVNLAKRADASDKAAADAESAKGTGEILKNFGGAADAKAKLYRAAKAAGDDVLAVLKQANGALAMVTKEIGHGGGSGEVVDGSAAAELQKMVEAEAAANPKHGGDVVKARVHLLDKNDKALALSRKAKAEREDSRA
jgi:hypothetical protein